jgi:hypothetical protein
MPRRVARQAIGGISHCFGKYQAIGYAIFLSCVPSLADAAMTMRDKAAHASSEVASFRISYPVMQVTHCECWALTAPGVDESGS